MYQREYGMMRFEDAFNTFIKDKPVTGWGFQLIQNVKQPNGFNAELGGYFTVYEGGYRMMFCGQSLGETPVQEALILDAADIIIARDTEDLRRPADSHEPGGF